MHIENEIECYYWLSRVMESPHSNDENNGLNTVIDNQCWAVVTLQVAALLN